MIKLTRLVNNRYRIIEKIGQGGMAVVYKTFDTTLNRFVALKVIRSEVFGVETVSRIVKRFEREAQTLAKLNHPNIVKVYDYGSFQGIPYLVMDYLNGSTLKDLEKPMSVEMACKYLIPIAKGLAHAHLHGVLHRDIKPSNILITLSGEAMLTDFGIAKLIEGNEDTSLTGTGVGIGTPEYMAPEQGLNVNVDHRADIYSLGVVMYELITGKKPFLADTPLAVLYKQMNDPLPDPLLINKQLTTDVVHFLYRTLDKNPNNRFATMDEMVEALNDLLHGDYCPADFSIVKPGVPNLSLPDDEETFDQMFSQTKKRVLEPKQKRVVKWALGVISLTFVTGLFLMSQSGVLNKIISINSYKTQQSKVTVTNNQSGGLDSRENLSKETLAPSITLTENAIIAVEPTIEPELQVISKDNIYHLQLVNVFGNGAIDQIALVNDEKSLLVLAGGTNHLYDAQGFAPVDPVDLPLPEHIKNISADGKYGVVELNGEYLVWDLQNGLSVFELPSDLQQSYLSFSPNNEYLMEATADYIATWDLNKKELAFKHEMEMDYLAIYYSIVTSDGIVLVPGKTHVDWAADSYTILVRNLNEDRDICNIRPGKSISDVKISPNGQTVTAMTVYDQLLIYEISTCSNIGTFNIPDKIEMGSSALPFFKYSPDGKFLAVNDAGNSLHILQISSEVELVQSISDPDEEMFADVLFTSSMERLYSISLSGTLRVWHGEPLEMVNSLKEFAPNLISERHISLGQKRVAFVSPKNVADSYIQVLETDTGKFGEKLLISYDVNSLDLSQGGNLLAAAGSDGIIRVYLTDGLAQINELHGHLSSVQVVKFSPDEKLLASGGSDGSIILWDISTGRNIRTLEAGNMWPEQILFSQDSSLLVVTGHTWFETWDVKSGSLISRADISLGTLKFTKTGQLIGLVEEEAGTLSVVSVDTTNGSYEKILSAGSFNDGNSFDAWPVGFFSYAWINLSPDENILIVGNKFFDFKSGEQLVLSGNTAHLPVTCLITFEDSTLILTLCRRSFAVYGIWQ